MDEVSMIYEDHPDIHRLLDFWVEVHYNKDERIMYTVFPTQIDYWRHSSEDYYPMPFAFQNAIIEDFFNWCGLEWEIIFIKYDDQKGTYKYADCNVNFFYKDKKIYSLYEIMINDNFKKILYDNACIILEEKLEEIII